jgi:hypothetical protein
MHVFFFIGATMNLKKIAYYTAFAVTAASIGYSTYRLVSNPKDIKLTIRLNGSSCTYRITRSRTELLTISLTSAIEEDWKPLFHDHLMNAVTHGHFLTINEVIHFICSRHRDILTYVE